jgi:hypothetical protein
MELSPAGIRDQADHLEETGDPGDEVMADWLRYVAGEMARLRAALGLHPDGHP